MAADSKRRPDDDNAERAQQAYAALGVGFVCIVIGLPLWWKTTEVYRVPLPYSDIAELKDAKITYEVHFTVINMTKDVDHLQVVSLSDKLKTALDNRDAGSPSAWYRFNVRGCFDEELQVYEKATSLQGFDDALESLKLLRENGKYTVILISEGSPVDPGEKGFVGRHRSSFMRSNLDMDVLVGKVKRVLQDLYVTETAMAKKWTSAVAPVHQQDDKESMRSLKSQPDGYEVTFTLLNPQPNIFKVSWNIQEATNTYLKPLLKAVHDYTNIRVKSQYLHSTGIGVRPKVDQRGGFELKSSQLPHIINPVEAFLGSHVSINPNLNFIVYIPSRDQNPLFIYDDSGEKVPSNAFLSPRWGGFLVYNIRFEENATLPIEAEIDMRRVMEVFAAQFRLLLGITPVNLHFDMEIAAPGNNIITDWELDKWLRGLCLENIATSIATLNSLAELLEKISNIVINDDIGREVHRAVASIQNSQRLLNRGQLRNAYLASRQAMQFSEKAFFDPSLLELLYFPEDQKFAIYIPLFLPVGIPVVISLIQSIKWLLKKRKHKKD